MLRNHGVLIAAVLMCFARSVPAKPTVGFQAVDCAGTYPHHLQGICTDGESTLFWSFTTQLVKTDRYGTVIKKVPVGNHHGDLCYHDGRVYVAVNFGRFNDPQGNADSWVYVYDADDLSLIEKHETQQVVYGAGGIAYHKGKFLVVGGLPAGIEENYVYEFDAEFRFQKKHVLNSGQTHLGIQTSTFANGQWYFGCYGRPAILLVADESLKQVTRYDFDGSLGMAPIANDRLLVARGFCTKEAGCTGRTVSAVPDDKRGLVIEESPAVSFTEQTDTEQTDTEQPNRLLVHIGDTPVAEYVFQHKQVLRPYFRHLRTLSGVRVTRNDPPIAGVDLDDHPTYHPGLWMAFGDLDGADFWRNKARVVHSRFIEQPRGDAGRGSFAAENVYRADGKDICTEECRIAIEVVPQGYLLKWTSTFRPSGDEFAFGDQEEMGLGVRVATPLAVKKGGQILNSDDRKNEKEAWGRQADWCTYGGTIDGHPCGVALMPHPDNFRRSWFHARDYGLLLANPFGRNAFTQGEPSRVVVKRGEPLTLRFGVLVYDAPAGDPIDIAAAYRAYVGE